MKIADACAVVTGGASGLGRATAQEFVAAGGRVAIIDRSPNGAGVAEELGDRCLFYDCDVTDSEMVARSVDAITTDLGIPRIVVNCAGGGGAGPTWGADGPIDIERFKRVLLLNVSGTVDVIRNAVRHMVRGETGDGEQGVIINTSSAAAFEGQIGQVAYAAAKAAIAGMTLPMARELGNYGIRVVAVAPGFFDTTMFHAGAPDGRWPQAVIDRLTEQQVFPGRLGRAEEFAKTCRHVVENGMFNGTTIRLDAGLRMHASSF